MEFHVACRFLRYTIHLSVDTVGNSVKLCHFRFLYTEIGMTLTI